MRAPVLKRLLVCAALVALGFTSWGAIGLPPASGQTAAPPARKRDGTAAQERPTFKVQSNLVVVDVTVRDRKGGLVRDLQRGDFRVLEDGVAQEIVTFSLEEIPAEPARAADAPADTARLVDLTGVPRTEQSRQALEDKRLVILFFDLSSLETEDLVRCIDSATEFVTRKATPNDLIGIATYSSTLELVHDLTNNRDALARTLKSLDPTQSEQASTDEQTTDEETTEDVYVPDSVQFNVFNTDRRLSAIESLAKMYREFPERKSVIYFSGGISTTGVENQAQVRSTVDEANQSNMSIYSVDSRGLVALPPGGDASRGSSGGRAMFTGDAVSRQSRSMASSQETLATLAYDTGGTLLQDTNELAPVFDKVVADTTVYYVLGYYAANTKEDGKFRKIKVEIARQGLKIQNRPGYFAAKEFTRMTRSERDRQLEEAFNVDRPFTDVPFILTANYFTDEESTSLVPVSLQLAGDGVRFEEKGNRRLASVDFLARVTDPKGKVAGLARDTIDVKLPVQRAEKIRTGQILYNTGFRLPRGTYKLKFLVRDNSTGKLGSFEQPLSVPALDGKSLQLSSVVLGSRLVAETHENPRETERPGFNERFRMLGMRRDPLVIGQKRIVPSIGNVFLSRQTLYVYFEVYGAAGESASKKPQIEAQLLFLQGRTRVRESRGFQVSDWSTDARNVADVSCAVPLAGLKKGNYVLQIHLRDRVSDTNLFRRVPLVIG
jgi:VWFA-related protein